MRFKVFFVQMRRVLSDSLKMIDRILPDLVVTNGSNMFIWIFLLH